MQRRIITRLAIVFVSLFTFFHVTEARAGVTSLLLTGDPGDYITQGRTYYFTQADGPLTALVNLANGVSISFHTPSYSDWWYLHFGAPLKQPLTVGVYTNAVRYPYPYIGSSQPGLDVSGDGRGCNVLTGSFEVLEIVYGSAGDVVSFRATFEQHCEGAAAAARGEIRYNATVPVQVTAPTNITAYERQAIGFTATATDVLGRHVGLTASGLPSGATFVDNGDNTGTFNWVPAEGQAGKYALTFRGDNGQGDVDTAYTSITVIAVPPLNDDFRSPFVITDVPSTFSQTTTRATTAYDDPFCAGAAHTVWYSFTAPTDIRLELNTFGSNYDTTLSVYTGKRGSLTQIACNDNSAHTAQSRVRFDAVAGETYFIMAGAYYNSPGGQLVLNVLPAPPPLSIGLAIVGFGDVVPSTGEVTVIGRITCSRPIVVTISGQLKQEHAQEPLTAQFAAAVPCDGTSDWSAAVVLAPALFEGRAAELFVGGPADVTATASAVDQDAGETAQSNAAASIILRGGR